MKTSSNTPTNLSELPCSTGSQVYCYDQTHQSEISIENKSVRNYQNPGPSHSKPTSAEYSDYSATGVGHIGHEKASDLNILQTTLKTTSFVDLDQTITSEQASNAEECNKAPSTRIRIRLYPQAFCCGYAYSVHTCPAKTHTVTANF